MVWVGLNLECLALAQSCGGGGHLARRSCGGLESQGPPGGTGVWQCLHILGQNPQAWGTPAGTGGRGFRGSGGHTGCRIALDRGRGPMQPSGQLGAASAPGMGGRAPALDSGWELQLPAISAISTPAL